MSRAPELPPELERVQRQAVRLEWITIAYMITAIAVVGLALGSSQAMKAAWVEDILSLLPPIAFLVAARVRRRPPDESHPWGYHRAVSIGYAAASFALFLMGLLILLDSLHRLALSEHPPIGLVELFGWEVWQGWVMIAALVYSGVPPVVLGRKKLRLAAELHDKVLYADAEMNRADWLTAGAAAVGVLGIGFGLWFADAVAGALISLDIVRDGVRNLRRATADLMDARAMEYDGSRLHPLNQAAVTTLLDLPWVREAYVRLREDGHLLAGEAFVVPDDPSTFDIALLAEAKCALVGLDSHMLRDVTVVPVTRIEDALHDRSPSSTGPQPVGA